MKLKAMAERMRAGEGDAVEAAQLLESAAMQVWFPVWLVCYAIFAANG